jgi:hypothetical protein
VHTHIIPPAVVAAGENGLYGMRVESTTLRICAHGVPLQALSKVDRLVERVRNDGLEPVIPVSSMTACWTYAGDTNPYSVHSPTFRPKTRNWPPRSLLGSTITGLAPLSGPSLASCLMPRRAMTRCGRR